MGIHGLGFAIREAFSSIRRNGLMSAVAVTTVAVCLFFLAGVILLSVNLSHMAGMWEEQVHVRVYLEEEIEPDVILHLRARILEIEGVEDAQFVSRDEALERLKQQFGQQKDLLAGIEGSNPLPNSFEVRVVPPQRIPEVGAEMQMLEGVESVQFRQDILDTLFQATAAVRVFGLVLVLVMGLGAVFIISNTIRITVFSRRREIGIMKLVGATDALIRGPFMIEGLILGLLGSALAAYGVSHIYRWVFEQCVQSLPFLPLVSPEPLLYDTALSLAVAGALLGASGSVLSIRRYLKV